MAPFNGYWGKPTSTLDWCEINYEVTYFIAEFWNTISNVAMIFLSVFGVGAAYKYGLEHRYMCCHLGILCVGVGSWCFHMTLLYTMQLLDELPMIWGTGFLLYSCMEISSPPKYQNRKLQLFLVIYCSVVTIVYLFWKNPIFHEACYGMMVFALIGSGLRIIWYYQHSRTLYVLSLATYGFGFILWNVDNHFCDIISDFRAGLPYYLRPLTQLHAWWHLFAGIGTYLAILFYTHARAKYLKREIRFDMVWGCVPVAVTSDVSP